MRDGFIIHEKTLRQFSKMTPEQIGELVLAMTAYYDHADMGEVSQLTEILMVDIAERMDADLEAYEKAVEKSLSSSVRSYLTLISVASANTTSPPPSATT